MLAEEPHDAGLQFVERAARKAVLGSSGRQGDPLAPQESGHRMARRAAAEAKAAAAKASASSRSNPPGLSTPTQAAKRATSGWASTRSGAESAPRNGTIAPRLTVSSRAPSSIRPSSSGSCRRRRGSRCRHNSRSNPAVLDWAV
jgi:hypothetical protein